MCDFFRFHVFQQERMNNADDSEEMKEIEEPEQTKKLVSFY